MEFGFLLQSSSDQLAIFLHVLCIIQILEKLVSEITSSLPIFALGNPHLITKGAGAEVFFK